MDDLYPSFSFLYNESFGNMSRRGKTYEGFKGNETPCTLGAENCSGKLPGDLYCGCDASGILYCGSAEFLSGIKKIDLLSPVITIVFYYGEKPWDGNTDLHGLLGLDRKEYRLLKDYVPNYQINLINPAEIEDLSNFEQNLQMVFGMLKYRHDKKGLEKYLEINRDYFTNIDEETYQAAKTMISAGQRLKDIKNEKENGGMNMCKALEDLYQEGIDVGKEQERKHSIITLIETCSELHVSYKDTLQKIQEKFDLPAEEVEKVMEKHWKTSALYH